MPVTVKNTNNVEFAYDEPTVNNDAAKSQLKDLKETRCFMRVLPAGIPSVVKIQPASSVNGGGKVVVGAVAPVLPGQEAMVEAWVVAVDDAGNISPESARVQVEIDMLAPAAPLL